MQTTMTPAEITHFEKQIEARVLALATADDPAHDILHFKRVVRAAKKFCIEENAALEIVMPAAWLHDFVIVPKNDPRRPQASKLAATGAIQFLKEIGYPERYFEAIAHAIEAHSFSAGIQTNSREAEIVQDADRLDGLGAIGIARCFATAGLMKRGFYEESDPFCRTRKPDDQLYTIDHFYVKLFKVAEAMKTVAGKREALKRMNSMKSFLDQLASEVEA